MTNTRIVTTLGLGALVFTAACSDKHYDILNTNAPTVEQLTGAPSKAILARAAIGVVARINGDLGGEMSFYAIFGREGYNLLGNDPRLTQEMLRGPLEAGGFGGANFQGKFIALRTINTYLASIDAAADMTAAEKAASKGFGQTLKAVLFHRLIVRNGSLGTPIRVDADLDAAPAPFVSQANTYAYLVALLDSAKTNLLAGGSAFPFGTPPGFETANTPANFLKFNRGLAAKVHVHRATLANAGNSSYTAALTALGESFVNSAGSLNDGAYYAFSQASGEPSNPITEGLAAQRFYVHPSILSGAQLKGNGQPDNRLTSKTALAIGAGANRVTGGLTGTHKPTTYNTSAGDPDLGADVAIIRNEELILLRAEANWFAGSKQSAIDDINTIRTRAGGLGPVSLTPASTNDQFVAALMYERLYSLLWEQGTRWVDARRFGKNATLPIDRAGDVIFPNMLILAAECDARGLAVPCTPPVQ